MKVLVDDRWFGATGIGRYAKEILQRKPQGNNIEYLSKSWAIKNPLTPLLLGREINRRVPDLFWSPGFMPPMRCMSPFIVTVHDLIHLRYGSKLQVIYYNEIIKPLLKQAAYVFTVSEFSRGEIIDWSGLPPEKVISIYNAASRSYSNTGDRFKPGYPYLLYVGNKRRHKNLDRLLKAFSEADIPRNLRLVLTGDEDKALSGLAVDLKIENRLVYLGHVDESILPSIYRGAVAVALVSLYEGFGIPAVESVACGTPVISSNAGALPEITQDAAYLVDPENIDEISAGIEKIVTDEALRKSLIHSGNIRSQEFSWDDSAGKVWEVFSGISK